MNELLSRIYYDVEKGYNGLNKLFIKAKSEDSSIKREDVNRFLKEQTIHQQYDPVVKSKNSFVADRPLFEFQIDIVNITVNKSTYVLTCIDVFSKIADAEILKDKGGDNTLDALKKIISRMGKPQQIYADKGREFDNKEMMEYTKKENIELILVKRHAPFVERFNLTFKTMLYKVITDKDQGHLRWRQYVPQVITNYNNSFHRTIRMTPNQALNNQAKALEGIGLNAHIGKPQYNVKVGDRVRMILEKGDFTRGFKPTYSKKVYVIHDVDDEKVLIGKDWIYKYDVKVFDTKDENEEE